MHKTILFAAFVSNIVIVPVGRYFKLISLCLLSWKFKFAFEVNRFEKFFYTHIHMYVEFFFQSVFIIIFLLTTTPCVYTLFVSMDRALLQHLIRIENTHFVYYITSYMHIWRDKKDRDEMENWKRGMKLNAREKKFQHQMHIHHLIFILDICSKRWLYTFNIVELHRMFSETWHLSNESSCNKIVFIFRGCS